MLILIGIIIAITAVIVVAVKLIHLSSRWDSDLDHPWPAETPVEINFKLDNAMDNWILQVRKKKRFRLFKDSGWKDVLLYYKWFRNENIWYPKNRGYSWNPITWPVGINQFKEFEIMESIIRTYGDLDSYYGLTEGYNEYMKQTFEEK